MKRLSDTDIEQMVADEFVPQYDATRQVVRAHLHLATRMPPAPPPTPEHATLDLHQHTVEQAWSQIMDLATSNVRTATIITGASGVLKQLFPTWATESILAPYIISYTPLNNGSFSVRFRRKKRR